MHPPLNVTALGPKRELAAMSPTE